MNTVLFVLAHQDDEVAFVPRIRDELANGNDVHCIYLTSGATRSVSSTTRCTETVRALTRLGMHQSGINFLGAQHGIPDGKLVQYLDLAFSALLKYAKTLHAVTRLFTLSWEGGHQDHDATHLIALALSKALSISHVYHAPLYNGFGTRGRFFRVISPLANWAVADALSLSARDGVLFASFCGRYPSQWRTWMGLGLGVIREYVYKRRHILYRANIDDVFKKPHTGALLYERMFGVPYKEFSYAAVPFLGEHIGTYHLAGGTRYTT